MIGTRIESSPSFPTLTLVLGVGWLMTIVCALALFNVHYAVGGSLLGGIAFVRWLYREQRLCIDVGDDGLFVNDSSIPIPYSSMRAINAPHTAMQSQFAIEVIHSQGALTIPASIDHSSETVSEFLNSKLLPKPEGFVNPALQDHWNRQRELFGEERVFLFSPRDDLAAPRRGHAMRILGLGMIATGAFWGLAATLSEIWIIPAILMGVFGGIFFLISFAKSDGTTPQIKNWKESTLIVTPAGIALLQGNLKGKLLWNEVRSIKFSGPKSFVMSSVMQGIVVQIAGSQLLILDLYDEPLSVIHKRMIDYFDADD